MFDNNILLTQTERLTMNNRPKDPKTARNKNVLVIGGSGSGKTRFFVKPNLMQCVSKDYPTSFTYKTVGFVWVKQNRKADSLFWGMGYWTRSNVELCILATKGHPKRINAAVHQVIVSHIEEHSDRWNDGVTP